jgi:CBS domain-containing protein
VFDYQVLTSKYMSEPVASVFPETPLAQVSARLTELGISSLVVVDRHEVPLGVISRTDLLKAGRDRAGDDGSGSLLDLDSATAADIMTTLVVCVDPDDTIATAAKGMVDHGLHRVFVTENDRVVGVLSTRDLMAAIIQCRDETMVAKYMSRTIITVDAHDSVANAVKLLEDAHVGGVIVAEDEWPVGMFAQADALRAANVPSTTAVEEVMNQSFVCVPAGMRMHRAAKRAVHVKARRVIVVNKHEAVGILTGLDFARCVSGTEL